MIVGIDEVGRGCWAGPLVAGAVLLGEPIAGLKDSKVLSRKVREQLDAAIRAKALALGIGWVGAVEVDEIGLTAAVGLAMRRALDELNANLSDGAEAYSQIIIDGSYNFLPEEPKAKTLIRADAQIAAVSAASILAKVARDQYMIAAANEFPMYGFEAHVGYGTAAHAAALAQHGICELHRQSFKPVAKIIQLGEHA